MRDRLLHLAALGVALALVPLSAHTLPLETTAYFKIEGSGLRVLVRLPMATLSDATLPGTTHGTLDLEAGRPALAAAAAEFSRSADIMDDGRPLPPPAIAWVVSGKNDPAFDSYATAAAHFSQTALPDLAPNEGYLDLQLDYRLTSHAPHLSIRFNGQRAGGEFVPTRAVYFAAPDDERRFAIAGPPHRVWFEPSLRDAAAMSITLGLRHVLGQPQLLLFLVCLAIPLRTSAATLKLVAAMLLGYIAVGVVAVAWRSPPGVALQLLCQLAAAIGLALAALQNLHIPRPVWIRSVALAFGAASGIAVGLAGREFRPFAGSWDLVGLALFFGSGAVLVLIVTPLLRAVVGAVAASVRRLPLSALGVSILLSLVPLHSALHAIQTDGQQLVDFSAADGRGLLPALVANWPPVVLVIIVVCLVIASRRRSNGEDRAQTAATQR